MVTDRGGRGGVRRVLKGNGWSPDLLPAEELLVRLADNLVDGPEGTRAQLLKHFIRVHRAPMHALSPDHLPCYDERLGVTALDSSGRTGRRRERGFRLVCEGAVCLALRRWT